MIVLHSVSMNSMPRNSGVSKRRRAISKSCSEATKATIEHTFDSGKPVEPLPPPGFGSMAIWLARHGETEWTVSGRHTGEGPDIALIPEGELQAIAIGKLLADRSFARVFASPMRRAPETARLAGFGDSFEVLKDLREVDYGGYEGVTTTQELRVARSHVPANCSATAAPVASRPNRCSRARRPSPLAH